MKLLQNYLTNRQQRVVLNGQSSSWKNVLAGVPQGSVLGPLLFLIYINDLPNDIQSTCKIFADDTSLFSKVLDKDRSQDELNNDLQRINQWAFQWKMRFNPDPRKQANEVCFSRKRDSSFHPVIMFNNNPVQSCSSQKHLGLILDTKVDFNQHINEKISRCNKIIGVMKRLSLTISRKSLLTIYKSFIRPHLDYADIIYDNPFNESFNEKIEKVQYNAALVITGAIKGTSRERLYQELGLESLRDRRWYHKLLFFYKILNDLSPSYLRSYIDYSAGNYFFTRTRSATNNIIKPYLTRTESFKSTFFPYCINEWNKLNKNIKNAESINKFKSLILGFIKVKENSIFGIHDPVGIKLLTRLRLNFSHLNEHKFRHNFRETLNPFCKCGGETETTSHFFLRCHLHTTQRLKLLDTVYSLNPTIKTFSDESLVQLLLYGSDSFDFKLNKCIINLTINYLKTSGRFDGPLF